MIPASFRYSRIYLNWTILDPNGRDAAQVARICELTGLDRDTFIGKYARWCSFAKSSHLEQLTPENAGTREPQVTEADVDAFVGRFGFAAALVEVGWLERVTPVDRHEPLMTILILGAEARRVFAENCAATFPRKRRNRAIQRRRSLPSSAPSARRRGNQNGQSTRRALANKRFVQGHREPHHRRQRRRRCHRSGGRTPPRRRSKAREHLIRGPRRPRRPAARKGRHAQWPRGSL